MTIRNGLLVITGHAYDFFYLTEVLLDLKLSAGPGYLNVNDLEVGYHAHLMIMHDSCSWHRSGFHVVKRFFRVGSA